MVTRDVTEKFAVMRGARLIDLREEESRVITTLRRVQHELSMGRRPAPPPTLPGPACPHCHVTYGLLLNKRRGCTVCGGGVCSVCLGAAPACPRCLAVERRASERAARTRLLQPQAASAAWYGEARLHSEDLPADLAALRALVQQIGAGRPDLLPRAQRQDRSLAALFAAFEVSFKKLEALPAPTAREAALIRNFRAGFGAVLSEQLPEYRLLHRALDELARAPPPLAPEPPPPPAVLAVASLSAVALPLGGGTVVIEGSGFEPGLQLRVGRRPAEVLVESSERLLATLPPAKPGQHQVTLELAGRPPYTIPVPVLYTAELSAPEAAPVPKAKTKVKLKTTAREAPRTAPDIVAVEPVLVRAGERAKISLGPPVPREVAVEVDGRAAEWQWLGPSTLLFTCPELVGVSGPVALAVRNLETNAAALLRDTLLYEGRSAGRAWGRALGNSPPVAPGTSPPAAPAAKTRR